MTTEENTAVLLLIYRYLVKAGRQWYLIELVHIVIDQSEKSIAVGSRAKPERFHAPSTLTRHEVDTCSTQDEKIIVGPQISTKEPCGELRHSVEISGRWNAKLLEKVLSAIRYEP